MATIWVSTWICSKHSRSELVALSPQLLVSSTAWCVFWIPWRCPTSFRNRSIMREKRSHISHSVTITRYWPALWVSCCRHAYQNRFHSKQPLLNGLVGGWALCFLKLSGWRVHHNPFQSGQTEREQVALCWAPSCALQADLRFDIRRKPRQQIAATAHARWRSLSGGIRSVKCSKGRSSNPSEGPHWAECHSTLHDVVSAHHEGAIPLLVQRSIQTEAYQHNHQDVSKNFIGTNFWIPHPKASFICWHLPCST